MTIKQTLVSKTRRLWMAMLLCISIVIMGVGPVAADQTIRIFIDGQELYSDVAPIIENGRTLVPVAAISAGLGADVKWLQNGRKVLISTKGPIQQVDLLRSSTSLIRVFIDEQELFTDVAPMIIGGRTMVPLAAISTGLGANVTWDAKNRRVLISTTGSSQNYPPAVNLLDTTILGDSVATAAQLRSLQLQNNPSAPDLAELYISIGREYGIRGDIAFCQAAKETGWWKYGGLVLPVQNNYCGLGATGAEATGEEDMHGADPLRVSYQAGMHGAFFRSPADGVEAQIQHLYAYACTASLPAGKSIVDPRYTLVRKGVSSKWVDLNGRWAVPGVGYGESILTDYYQKIFN